MRIFPLAPWLGLASLATLVACGSTPEVVDETPFVRTAVVTSNIANNGFKGFFANDAIHTIKTTAEMQRVDDKLKYTGSILGRVSKGEDRSEILRLDKNLEWQLDNRKQEYFECELGGCASIATFNEEIFGGGTESEEEDDSGEPLCELETVTNRFDIRKTGEQREIGSFPSEEYVIDWVHTMKDGDDKLSENVIGMVVWTTPETGEVAEAVRMQRAFDERYRAALGQTYPENLHQAVPGPGLEIFARFLLANLSEADLEQLNRLIGKATPIVGYPVSRKVEWSSKNETCAAPPEEDADDGDTLNTKSIGGLLSSIGKTIVNQEVEKKKEAKRREIAMAPVFSITEEVTSIVIDDRRESQMSVPAKYKLQTRR